MKQTQVTSRKPHFSTTWCTQLLSRANFKLAEGTKERLALWWPWPHSDVTESGRCMTSWLLFLGQCLRDRRQLLGVTTQHNSRVITTSCWDDSLVLWQSCDRKCCTNSTRLETNCNAVAESSISGYEKELAQKYVSSIYAIYGIIILSLVLSLCSINYRTDRVSPSWPYNI